MARAITGWSTTRSPSIYARTLDDATDRVAWPGDMDAPRRNVELKARDHDPEASLAAALRHGAADQGVLTQTDTYFAAREGRLKLREEDGAATLIAYARADAPTARTSAYHLVAVADPAALKGALDGALGTVVVVAKRRRLLLWQEVR